MVFFGGRKLFLPGHFGLIFDGRVETCFYHEASYGPLNSYVTEGVTEGQKRLGRADGGLAAVTGAQRPHSSGKGRNVFLPHQRHTPIETKMRQGKKVER